MPTPIDDVSQRSEMEKCKTAFGGSCLGSLSRMQAPVWLSLGIANYLSLPPMDILLVGDELSFGLERLATFVNLANERVLVAVCIVVLLEALGQVVGVFASRVRAHETLDSVLLAVEVAFKLRKELEVLG